MNNNKSTNRIDIYIDGARPGGSGVGVGGWGVLFIIDGIEETMCGGMEEVTNNQMELMAAIKALEALPPQTDFPVTIYCDSQYVIDGITKWIHGWKKSNWVRKTKKAKNEPVKNVELWKDLDFYASKHNNITWKWVKGHSGNYGNERADRLANRGACTV